METENDIYSKERYYQARKRVEEIKGFYSNLAAYIFVNTGLLILNLVTSPEELWFYWPLFGWGIGVLFHGIKVFNVTPFFGKEWEEQKIREYMEKEKQNNLTANNQ